MTSRGLASLGNFIYSVLTLPEVSRALCCEFEICWKWASAMALLASASENNTGLAPCRSCRSQLHLLFLFRDTRGLETSQYSCRPAGPTTLVSSLSPPCPFPLRGHDSTQWGSLDAGRDLLRSSHETHLLLSSGEAVGSLLKEAGVGCAL